MKDVTVMEKRLLELVTELIENDIVIWKVGVRNGTLAFDIVGFAKSGFGVLYLEDNKIILETRFRNKEEVYSLKDIARVAYSWDCRYYRENNLQSHSIEPCWKKLYESYGWETENLKG